MIPLLAAQVDNNVLLGGVLGTFALLFGLYVKMRAWEKSVRGDGEKREIGPQPFDVRMNAEPLTLTRHKELCEPLDRRVHNLENDVRMIRLKMDSDKNEIISAGEDRSILIHNRINDIDRKVSALDERTETTNSTLTIQSQKLDRIFERLSQ